MLSSRLLLIEVVALLVAALVLWMIVSPPFGSSEDGGGTDDALVSENGGGDAGDDGDAGNDGNGDISDDDDKPARPAGDSCAPAVGPDFMRGNQVLSYYGNPDSHLLGILGEHEPDELVSRLKSHARTYDELNGFRGVQAGLHLVYATAQAHPGDDGLYIRRLDTETLEEYIRIACEAGLFIFLDLQIGRSDLKSEIERVLPYLQQSHVHLALDPEFAMEEDEVPGQEIGHLEASQINRAQEMLDGLIEEHNLPDKILVVHQFQDSMIPNPEEIEDFRRVQLVIDADGFGEPATKAAKFNLFAAPAEHGGIKLFFKQDDPLMSEEEVLKVRPDLIIYQ